MDNCIPISGKSAARKSLCMAHRDALWRVLLWPRSWRGRGAAYQPRPPTVKKEGTLPIHREEIRGKLGWSVICITSFSFTHRPLALFVFPKSISVGAGPRPVSSTRREFDFEWEGRKGGCEGENDGIKGAAGGKGEKQRVEERERGSLI